MDSNSGLLHVSDIMSDHVVTVRPSEKISVVASKLLKLGVGSVLVVDHFMIIGIITKGDILRGVVLKLLDASEAPAEAVMSSNVVTIKSTATVEEAALTMSDRRVSKLPVIGESGDLVGIITSTDIIRSEPGEVDYLQELVRARFVPHELRT